MKQLFKSATAYTIKDPAALKDLSALNERPVEECAPGQLSRHGWENPYNAEFEGAAYHFDHYAILCMAIVQKCIKPAAINRATLKKVREIEKAESRTVGRKERQSIKDEIILGALPAALSEEKRIYAYIDWDQNILVIDQHSPNACDLFTSTLREDLGSLNIIPKQPGKMPELVMASWVKDYSAPPEFTLEGDAVFKNPVDLSQTARVKHVEIDGAGVLGLLEDGMIPQEITLSWQLSETSSLCFKLSDTVTLKAISFSDGLIADDDGYDDAELSYRAEMLINCESITGALNKCFSLFGA